MDSYLTHNGEKKWDEIKFLKRLETTYNYINIYIVTVEQFKLNKAQYNWPPRLENLYNWISLTNYGLIHTYKQTTNNWVENNIYIQTCISSTQKWDWDLNTADKRPLSVVR